MSENRKENGQEEDVNGRWINWKILSGMVRYMGILFAFSFVILCLADMLQADLS